MNRDLILMLKDDIPSLVAIRTKAVTEDKIINLLQLLRINNITTLGEFFNYDKPIIKFARLYRDYYILKKNLEGL